METVWKDMKATRLRNVEASVAAMGPTGVAFQIHHTVAMFHEAKTAAAHPAMRHHERRESSYSELIHSNGTRATGSVAPVSESHPGESRRIETIDATIFRAMKRFFVRQK